jgi:hypothetical protein
MARFEIKDGPDKSDLLTALAARRDGRSFTLMFTVMDLAGDVRKVKMHVRSVGIKGGSGHSWIITLQSANFTQYYEGDYRTDTRKGYIVEVAQGRSREQTVRRLLEDAMVYGHTIKLTIAREWTSSPFSGQTVIFTNVRASDQYPLSRFCATPTADNEHRAERVEIHICSVESVEWIK